MVVHGLAFHNKVVEGARLGVEDYCDRLPFDLADIGRNAGPIGGAILFENSDARDEGMTREGNRGYGILWEGQLIAVLRSLQDHIGATRVGGHLHDLARR